MFHFVHFLLFVVNVLLIVALSSVRMNANGLALGEEADFEALNCQPSTKVDTR
jgi:hypothetical protein